MDSLESVVWLKQNNLFNKCLTYAPSLKPVFAQCLNVKDEDILIVGDTGKPDRQVAPLFAGACFLAARSMSLNAKLYLQKPMSKGEPAAIDVNAALERIRPGSAIVFGLSERLGSLAASGKPLRQFCKDRRLRYTTTPSLGSLPSPMIRNLVNAINVDYTNMSWLHREVKKMLDYGEILHLTTKAGTDLKVPIKGCTSIASEGLYRTPGLGGNLPGGEVFIAPAKKSVEGTVIVDVCSKNMHTTTLVKKPIRLTVEHGEVTQIEGGKEAKLLEDSLAWSKEHAKHDWGMRRLGEVGIGLNPNASICGSMIIDEKVKGTAHVAIGSNHWFGGTVYSQVHLDQVFRDPRITIDGKYLQM